jgi:uncharacterized protein with von Willebrand factor type A (vWA) domain
MDALEFVAAVRSAGVEAGPDRVQALLHALGALDATHPAALYWAGRLTLCRCADDVARYDRAVAGIVSPPRPQAPPLALPIRVRQPERSMFRAGAPGTAGDEDGDALGVVASPVEVLRHRDLATLSDAERAEAARLLAMLARLDLRRTGRRFRRANDGAIDPRRTVRALMRADGEPVRLARRDRRTRPRPLVLLIDVSGSMSPYADALLRFAQAAVRHRPFWTEVYTVGTRLTRVTPALRQRDASAALSASIPDWRGGTRLADTLTDFLRRDGHRGVARRAVVVVFSDGWERGDPAPLGEAAAHLRRLAYRLIWVSPHAARQGFSPTAGGLAAVAPHLDALVGGHSVAALEQLISEVTRA